MNLSITSEKQINMILKEFSPENSVIISANKNIKEYTDIKVFSLQEFCKHVIQKSPQIFSPQIITKTESVFIIRHIINETFKNNQALYNLTKSNSFSLELYKLFGNFISSKINPETLLSSIEKIEIDKEDLERFKIIIQSFEKYIETLKLLDYIDQNNLPPHALNLLKSTPEYTQKIQHKIKNIIIDSSTQLNTMEQELINLVGAKVVTIDLIKKHKNKAIEAISKKYLGKNFDTTNKDSTVEIFEFEDIVDECKFIIENIATSIENNSLNFSDFAIVLNNSKSIKNFLDALNLANIPTNYTTIDENYKEFLLILSQYFNLCENLLKLEVNSKLSKAELEQIYSEINLNVENIITQVFKNQFIKDKFLTNNQNLTQISLLKYIENNLHLLVGNDVLKMKEELSLISQLSLLYKNKNYAEFIINVANKIEPKTDEFQENIAKLIKQINLMQKTSFRLKHTSLSLMEINEILHTPTIKLDSEEEDFVTIGLIDSFDKKNYKQIFIPDFTDKSIPKTSNIVQFISSDANQKISNILKKYNAEFPSIVPSNEENIKDTAKNLIDILYLSEKTYISTHKYEDKKQMLPSIFFQFLKSLFKVNQNKDLPSQNDDELGFCKNLCSLEQAEDIVITDTDIIHLNASAISNFQTCPRKFYFKNLLGLNEKSTFEASYGTIAHAIMELFNTKYLDNYNKETIASLTDKLFNSINNPEEALNTGFSQKIIDLINASDYLSLAQMKDSFFSAIDELEKNSFFNKIPDSILCEKSFEFSIPEIPNVIFDGRIDAIYKFGDTYSIVDFKTGKNKPELSYLISENGVNFKTKTGRDTNIETKQNEFEYQIPVYYLASKYSKDFVEIRNNISKLGLLYIRPKNKENGFKEDFVTFNNIQEFENKLIENINTTIINKIRNCAYFEPKYNELNCKKCAFKSLCNTNNEDESDD